jgi:hypothetical protein
MGFQPQRKVTAEQAQWYCLTRDSVLARAESIPHEQSRRLLEQMTACHEAAARGETDLSTCTIHELPRDEWDTQSHDDWFSTWLCRSGASEEGTAPEYCSYACSSEQPCFRDEACSEDATALGCTVDSCRFCSGSDVYQDIPCA